ncbi:DUF2158 domain-containing protein [Blastopirellula marina]|uniref:DUF2158 domain-containing protein n=1 Tax=Blastopirellula marina TaxID=124 RepID=A0A2S8F7F8_9BACT|nr:DUF2158 domain-containing protein [Blastopirellula marina]RCS48511.1 DUF2158 domain-containing protein [Bremerella cremea]
MNLKIGDVVRLKSGGPQMTVDHIENDDVHVAWFDGRKCKRVILTEIMLCLVNEQEDE